ncbi:MAG TPA: hypothetical protein VK797_14530, partial [Tepidisphaeraceae bacterium]|nr:hypothetical protein [Tepidisphaeraceae bacterium]
MPLLRERPRALRAVLSTLAAGLLSYTAASTALAQTTRPSVLTTRPTTMPTTRVALRFEDAQLKSVLGKLCDDFGFTLVRNDAPESTRISIYSPYPVPPEEAIKELNAALKDKGGYVAILNDDKILRVLNKSDALLNPPVYYGTEGIPDTDEIRTQVMAVGALDAVKLKVDLTPLVSSSNSQLMANAASNSIVMTDRATNIRRVADIINKLNYHSVDDLSLRVIKLNFADADATAKLIMTLFNPQ